MVHSKTATDVTILGLGAMGSAFAATLLKAGKRVTVWNRTTARADALVENGALLAPDVAAAIAASPISLVIFLDQDAVDTALTDAVLAAGAGTTLVNLTTAAYDEHRALAERAHSAGLAYLSGGIFAYPRNIGDTDTTIFYSGDEAAFERHAALLRLLAGAQVHVGADPGMAGTVFLAMAAAAAPALIALFEAAAWGEARGIPPADMCRYARSVIIPFLDDSFAENGRRLATEDLDGGQATIDTFAAAFEVIASEMKAAGGGMRSIDLTLDYVRRGQANDLGAKDFAALYGLVANGGR